MEKITMTCPFTGCEFTAAKDFYGNVYFTHPITGEQMKANYNYATNMLFIPRNAFEHIETISFADAAEYLKISRQRISAIAANNTIRPVIVNGQQCFLKSDVVKYGETRKVGAPRKDNSSC